MNRQKAGQAAWLLGAGAGLMLGVSALARHLRREDFQGRIVVISGGSRGLGLLLAREFGKEGARLALLARDGGELEKAAQSLRARGFQALAIPCDIRHQEQVDQAIARVVDTYGRIDILVNVAGVIQVGPFETMTIQDFRDAMDVHFWGPLYTSLAVIEVMRRYRSGRIVNITSIGGEVAVPHLLPYTASKYAQLGLSDGMRAELAKEGIAVTTVIPGLMRTGSYVNALFKGQNEKEYAWFSLADALPVTSTSAPGAARKIVNACRYKDPTRVITWQARFIMLLNAVFPDLTAWLMQAADRWILPGAPAAGGEVSRTGWESQSNLSPSPLTYLGDQAVPEANQIPGGPAGT